MNGITFALSSISIYTCFAGDLIAILTNRKKECFYSLLHYNLLCILLDSGLKALTKGTPHFM